VVALGCWAGGLSGYTVVRLKGSLLRKTTERIVSPWPCPSQDRVLQRTAQGRFVSSTRGVSQLDPCPCTKCNYQSYPITRLSKVQVQQRNSVQ